MKVACIGGGPAGLYLGILLRQAGSHHEVTVYERNSPRDTFGFGVVFSDATLGQLATADPPSHAAITKAFARWDDIEIHFEGQVLRSRGHGFCGIERKQLLAILQTRARELGVAIRYEHEIKLTGGCLSPEEASGSQPDVIIACDGVASSMRLQRAAAFAADVDVRPNKFVWLGTTLPLGAFTFYFKQTNDGLFRVHAYPYSATGSTFIVECTAETWARAGFEGLNEDQTVAVLEGVFADELRGHRLIKNRSIWRNFPTVRCGHWCSDNVVLIGDAAHTAHFSIGSGTKLAMEDAIALADALASVDKRGQRPDPESVRRALLAYEGARRGEVEALQAAAQASLEWFESTERVAKLPPVQFAYHLLTRSLRVSHASMKRRDPELATAAENLLAPPAATEEAAAGVSSSRRPVDQPLALGPLSLPCRRAAVIRTVARPVPTGIVGDDHLVAIGSAALRGAGLLLTEDIPSDLEAASGGGRLDSDEHVVAWRRVVDYVHSRTSARVAATICTGPQLVEVVDRARFSGFDALAVVPADDEKLPALVAHLRNFWPADRGLLVQLSAANPERAIARSGQLVGTGVACFLDAPPSLSPASVLILADRIRNQHGLVTLATLASSIDADAAIAAGRVDAIVGPE